MASRQGALIKNALIIAFGKLSTQFVSFLLLPLYTAYLTTSEFGTVDLIITYVFLLAPILTVQLELASFRFLIDARGDDAQKRAVISNVLLVVSRAVLAFAVAFFILTRFITIPYSELIFGAVVAAITSGLFLQFARGLGDNMKFSIASVVTGLTTIIGNILMIVVFGMGAEGMLMAIITGNIAGALYLFVALKLCRYIRLSEEDKELRRRLLSYSAPLVPNGVAWWIINAADRTIITLFLGVASNGVLAVAYKFPLIFSGLFSFFGMSWTESASVHIDSPDRDKFFSQTMNASIRVFGSLGILMISSIPLVFGIFVGDNYSEAYLYIPILLLGAFFNSIVGLYSAIYVAKKMTKQVATTTIMSAGMSIAFTLAFAQFIGIYAAAFAMVVSYLAMAIYRHYDMKKYINIAYKKQIFVQLAVLYAFSISMYYLNNTVANIISLATVVIILAIFNWTIVSIVINKIMLFTNRRSGRLNTDQEVREESQLL